MKDSDDVGGGRFLIEDLRLARDRAQEVPLNSVNEGVAERVVAIYHAYSSARSKVKLLSPTSRGASHTPYDPRPARSPAAWLPATGTTACIRISRMVRGNVRGIKLRLTRNSR